jgi:hypothetical protein
MPFIINARGERVTVDIEADWFSQGCVLYADDVELKDYYILNLYKGNDNVSERRSEPELIKQIELSKLPTKDEIMHYMWKNGLSRYDIATIEKGFILDWK